MEFRRFCLKIVITEAPKNYRDITFKCLLPAMDSFLFFKLCFFAGRKATNTIPVDRAILAFRIIVIENIVSTIFPIGTLTLKSTLYYINFISV